TTLRLLLDEPPPDFEPERIDSRPLAPLAQCLPDSVPPPELWPAHPLQPLPCAALVVSAYADGRAIAPDPVQFVLPSAQWLAGLRRPYPLAASQSQPVAFPG